ncbi:MAG: tRNA cytosine(34) acetyltransferase TmcA [Proteobacteria bacterium SW_6_67_9]|nr:MAG: tRNA cytosine(34) acetyltransferase TmcA [Proteobacteria bacterium SW_6_67_9]
MAPTTRASPAPEEVAVWLRGRAAAAARAGHRALVILAGPHDWGRACAEAAGATVSAGAVLWVSDAVPEGAWSVTGPEARQLLGRETAHVVFDAHAGFNPDAFGAVAGTIRAGGLLVVLAPALAAWPAYPDPEYDRVTVPPCGVDELQGRFLARLVRRLQASPEADCIEAGQPLPELPATEEPEPRSDTDTPDSACRTSDQGHAVAAIERVAEGRARRPVVLTADRGRGKSAALGLAAARLLDKGFERVLVTAPTRDAVAPLFTHAAEQLPAAQARRERVALGEASITFVPADELARQHFHADLVLVDEAAGLPGPLLEALLRAHTRIAFATTRHGYEGSGRGFAVRFERVLDAVTPHWRRLTLETPIRWAPGDPLERFVFDALLLDAEAASDADVAGASARDATIAAIDRDALAADEATLRQVFGLLVMAHYRTTPGDLRNLLDGPNCRVWLARRAGAVVSACLTADEGALDDGLAEAVAGGERRARGHLLPQTLAFHGFDAPAASAPGRRIVRIAVHPACQGRGLGGALVEHVRAASERAGYAYWGAAFGAMPDLVRFFRHGVAAATSRILRRPRAGAGAGGDAGGRRSRRTPHGRDRARAAGGVPRGPATLRERRRRRLEGHVGDPRAGHGRRRHADDRRVGHEGATKEGLGERRRGRRLHGAKASARANAVGLIGASWRIAARKPCMNDPLRSRLPPLARAAWGVRRPERNGPASPGPALLSLRASTWLRGVSRGDRRHPLHRFRAVWGG